MLATAKLHLTLFSPGQDDIEICRPLRVAGKEDVGVGREQVLFDRPGAKIWL